MSKNRGIFVTFEGADASGKTTHAKFFASLLQKCGYDVVSVREPGGCRIGERLRDILLDSTLGAMTSQAELFLYEAARAQIVREVIMPALGRGACVISDRFSDSTLAYQGYGRGLDPDFICDANSFAVGSCKPDRTLILICEDDTEARSRRDRRSSRDRLEAAGLSFQERVLLGFREIAERGDPHIRVIDTSGLHSATAQQIIENTKDLFSALNDADFKEDLLALDAAHPRKGRKG